MNDSREQQIIDFIKQRGACSSKDVHDNVDISVSYATLKRVLSKLITDSCLVTVGQGKEIQYTISPTFAGTKYRPLD